MLTSFSGFEWDSGNRSKCLRHGVSIEEIESMFESPLTVFPDAAHSKDEERFIIIGNSWDGDFIFAVFTIRIRDGQQLVRPISARYMHRKEIEYYEKETAKTKKR